VLLTTRGGFENLAHEVAKAFGLAGARMVVIEHPLGGVTEEVVLRRANAIVDDVLRLWTT
jgi:hypothetical protein